MSHVLHNLNTSCVTPITNTKHLFRRFQGGLTVNLHLRHSLYRTYIPCEQLHIHMSVFQGLLNPKMAKSTKIALSCRLYTKNPISSRPFVGYPNYSLASSLLHGPSHIKVLVCNYKETWNDWFLHRPNFPQGLVSNTLSLKTPHFQNMSLFR